MRVFVYWRKLLNLKILSKNEKNLARVAQGAPGGAPLCPPLQKKPSQVTKLDGPGNHIGGDGELVVENFILVHFLASSAFCPDLKLTGNCTRLIG